MDNIKILGIDPGIARLGWAVVEYNYKRDVFSYIASSLIETHPNEEKYTRLYTIFEHINNLLEQYKCQYAGVEEVLFSVNVKTAMLIGEVRGVINIALSLQNVDVIDLNPTKVKLSLTGHGRAGKHQMQKMVKLILGLDFTPKPDDVADAIAIAIATVPVLKERKLFKVDTK